MQKKKNQSHNLSHRDLRDLKYAQQSGEQEFVNANKDSSVKIPAIEQHLVHVSVETEQFSQGTGERQSVPRITNFYPADFKRMQKEGAFAGQKVIILHEPEDLSDVKVKPEDKANTGQAAHVGDNTKEVVKDIAAGKGVTAIKQPVVAGLGTDEDISKLTQPKLIALYAKVFGVAHENPKEIKANLVKAIQDKQKEIADAHKVSTKSRDELIETYTKLWDEAPNADMTDEELIEAIAEKNEPAE